MKFFVALLIILAYGQLERKIIDLQTRISALEYYHKNDHEYEMDCILSDALKKKKRKKKGK